MSARLPLVVGQVLWQAKSDFDGTEDHILSFVKGDVIATVDATVVEDERRDGARGFRGAWWPRAYLREWDWLQVVSGRRVGVRWRVLRAFVHLISLLLRLKGQALALS